MTSRAWGDLRLFSVDRLAMVRAALLVFLLATLAFATPSFAQQIKPLDVEPDPNGVNLLNGKVEHKLPSISVPAAPNLSFEKLANYVPLLQGSVPSSGTTDDVSYSINAQGIASDSFKCFDACGFRNGRGSTLSGGITQGPFVYTQGGSGKKITFDIQTLVLGPSGGGDKFYYLASEILYPNGETLTFVYDHHDSYIGGVTIRDHRTRTVTSSTGYRLEFDYETDTFGTAQWLWLKEARIVAVGNPTVPLARLTYTDTTVTDLAGRVYACDNCRQTKSQPQPSYANSLTLPGETNATFDVDFTDTTAGHDLDISVDGIVYDYSFNYAPGYPEGAGDNVADDVTITGPSGFYRYVDITNVAQTSGGCVNASCGYAPPRQQIASIVDSQGKTTSYQYDVQNRVIKVTRPEADSVEISYDNGANIIEMRQIAKPGSGQADLVQYADYTYTAECDQVTCFLPNWTKDAKGNQTDYTWAAHGGLLTQLDPANAQNKRRKVKNSYAQSASGIWRLTQEEICEADAAGNELTCGTASSYVRQLTYWLDTLLPLSETVTDGAGNAPITTTYTYDSAGRVLSTDGPLPGTDDASYAIYDILGRKIWEIGPEGENGLRPATKTTYRDADDKPLQVQTGTVTDALASNFALISQVDTEYNARRLATKATVSDGTNAYAVSQISYDALNREDCTAIRMNPATWASLPTDACTLGTSGADGPDRISRKHYDTESRVTRIEQGVGTTLVRDYATYTFTPNGQMASMTDARGFKASMLYDGFDRQTHWYFPDPVATGAINPNDYEQYTYDANGNRLTLRKRDGSVLSYTYDNLNRVTKKTVPERAGLDATHTRDVFYMYDIRGLQLRATFDSLSGDGLYTTYDRYGRVTINRDRKDGTNYYLRYGYNVDGSRSWMRYPDLVQFDYAHSSGGQFNQIKDGSNAVLLDYNYNTRGELSQIDRASTAPDQDWTYDPIGRLASTGWSNGAAALNVSWSFTRNPANQIESETQTNDAYSWDGHSDVTRSYVTNGLNQYTSVSGTAYCYDKNGNLTLDGQYVYLYDVENRLVEMRAKANTTCASLAYTGQLKARLRYDALGRLHEVEGFVAGVSQGKQRFLYDGDALVAEYNTSGTMLKRYIHGPNAGADDPLVGYTGSGTAAANRRNLYADARGSIVLSTDSAGGAAQINSYDEYGVPGSTNTGRFQYTGQIWLPELGMNYYKARMYSPLLGRFMQTDPIGYEDNVNLYGYVGNDPVNGVDPTGMAQDDKRTFERGGSLLFSSARTASIIAANAERRAAEKDEAGQGGSSGLVASDGQNCGGSCSGGSQGGGGSSGDWIGPNDEVDENGVPVIVVNGLKAKLLVAPPRFEVVFGYPGKANDRYHVWRHLIDAGMSDEQIRSLQRKITGDVQLNFDEPGRYPIEFGGKTYLYGAFQIRSGLINVGSIYEPRDNK